MTRVPDHETHESRPLLVVAVGSLDVGGAERHLLQVLPRLAAGGLDVRVVTLHRRGMLADELERRGVPVLQPALPAWLAAWRPLRAVAVIVWYVRLFARIRPHIVHAFLPEAYICAGLAAVIAGVPIRVMSRRSLNHYQRSHPFTASLERWLHRRMTAVLGNSNAVRRDLRREGVPESRLGLIPNGVDVEIFRPMDRLTARRTLDLPDDALVLVCIANLIPYKGHADLFAALGLIKDRLPDGWLLVLVGRDEGAGAQLRDQARQQGIADNILWFGERNDVPDIFAASDVGLLCSHEEGFPNAVLEGQASGVPMIVTDVGGSPEAVADGQTGLVVRERTPAAIAGAVLALSEDPALRAAMGRQARTRVRESFSLNACVERYERLYDRLAADDRRTAVVGYSGAGRTAAAANLLRRASVPLVMVPALFSRITAYVILIVAARILAPEDFGAFTVLTVIGGIVNAVVSGGGDMWLNRFATRPLVGKGRPPRIWAFYLAISGTVALVCVAVAGASIILVAPLASFAPAILAAVLAFGVAGLTEALLAMMRASGRTASFFTLRDIIAPGTLLVLMLVIRPATVDILFVIYLFVWLAIFTGLVMFISLFARWPLRQVRLRAFVVVPAMKHTGFLMLANLGSRLANYIDVLGLLFVIGLSELGEYRVAAQFAIGFLVVQHFVFLNLPYQLRDVGEFRIRRENRQRLRDHQRLLVVLSALALAAFLVGAEWLLSLFGQRFVAAADIFRILLVIRFAEIMWGPQHEVLVSNGLVRFDASANLAGIGVWLVTFSIASGHMSAVPSAIVATAAAIHAAHAFRAYGLIRRGIYVPRLLPLPNLARSKSVKTTGSDARGSG